MADLRLIFSAMYLFMLPILFFSKTYVCLNLYNPFHDFKAVTEVHDLLPNYGLPRGLLPDNVESYTLSPSGSFSIQLTNPCYVHFDRLVYFDKEIKGKLSYGGVHEVSGIQAKKLFLWVYVSAIEVSKDEDGMIEFFVGPLSEKLPAKQFEDIPVCKSKAVGTRSSLEYM
ncbi:hypothetical protein K2173_010920 [Erythroxylum novogranatense]|uniref:Uncharacterized protein n=1 Tax=Erythroxylum novogranatense TaxID=1862640 RepID=A0AAV8T1S7_9ROSI|nr:hypothetical protein K2173_010920 [Erythroxylum novogranatense]